LRRIDIVDATPEVDIHGCIDGTGDQVARQKRIDVAHAAIAFALIDERFELAVCLFRCLQDLLASRRGQGRNRVVADQRAEVRVLRMENARRAVSSIFSRPCSQPSRAGWMRRVMAMERS
jgi:hypothetical protein